jgi:hypothetical protein
MRDVEQHYYYYYYYWVIRDLEKMIGALGHSVDRIPRNV